jgi:hypothetical protein
MWGGHGVQHVRGPAGRGHFEVVLVEGQACGEASFDAGWLLLAAGAVGTVQQTEAVRSSISDMLPHDEVTRFARVCVTATCMQQRAARPTLHQVATLKGHTAEAVPESCARTPREVRRTARQLPARKHCGLLTASGSKQVSVGSQSFS